MSDERKLQIGVIGSAADLVYSKEVEIAAEQIGEFVALSQAVLFFGAEKDLDSLSTAACRGAKSKGGLTVGITYGKTKDIHDATSADIVIPTGLDRGGGREFVLVLACDAIIAISGGSGTLTEMVEAYQAGIPIVALVGFGGWADNMAGQYFDGRKRNPVLVAHSPEEAVRLAVDEAKKKTGKL